MEKPSSNLQVAISSLVAFIFVQGTGLAVGLAGILGAFSLSLVTIQIMFTAVPLLFLPLLLWRHKAGFVGTIAVSVATIVGATAGSAAPPPGFPREFLMINLFEIVLSVVLIVFVYRASREKT